MHDQTQRPDAEQFARYVLFQLASIRTDLIQTRRSIDEVHAFLNKLTQSEKEERVRGLQALIDLERDRIYRLMLEQSRIPEGPN